MLRSKMTPGRTKRTRQHNRRVVTADEAARLRDRAADLLRRLGTDDTDDRADEIETLSASEYAALRGWQINPAGPREKGENGMADTRTKADLLAELDEVEARAEAAESALQEIIGIAEGGLEEDQIGDDDDEDD